MHAAKTTAAIESIAALQRELEEHMTNLLDKVQHRLDEVESTIDLVDRTEAELLERRTSLRAETEAHFDDLIHQMLSRKEQLLRDIDDITGKKQVRNKHPQTIAACCQFLHSSLVLIILLEGLPCVASFGLRPSSAASENWAGVCALEQCGCAESKAGNPAQARRVEEVKPSLFFSKMPLASTHK